MNLSRFLKKIGTERVQSPNRIKAFLWKLAHGKLLTNIERNRRGMTAYVICSRCNSNPETIMHILRDCEEAQQCWNNVIKPEHWSKFFSLGFFPWSEWNLTTNNIGVTPWSWFTFFSISVNEIWKDRNCLVFSNVSKLRNELWNMI